MKATINGIQVECTPEEFTKTLELIGKIEKQVVIKHVYPQAPNWQEPYYIYGTKITCDSTSGSTTNVAGNIQGKIVWN